MTTKQLSLALRWESDSGDILPSLTFSPDGALLASGEYDKELGPLLQLWDMQAGTLKHRLPLTEKPGQGTFFYQMAFSPDGTLLVSAPIGSWGITALWEVGSGRRRATFDTHAEALAVSPDSQLLACASDHVRLLDVQSGNELAVLEVENYDKSAFWDDTLTFNPTGTLLATACWMGGEGDEYVRLWDMPHRTLDRMLPIGNSIRQLAFSPDGLTLMVVTVSDIRFWNTQTGQESAPHQPLPSEIIGYGPVAFSPDRRMLATTFCDRQPDSSCWETVGLVDTETGQLLVRADDLIENGFWVVALSSANQLAAVEEDRCVYVWNIH